MKKHIHDAEHNTHLDQYRDGLVRQEFICYTKTNNRLRKETVVRTYYTNGEYTDSSTTETITDVN
jgi:hypothetical protein